MSSASGSSIESSEKQVLVCLGERKRGISFLSGALEKKAFLDAVRETYKDVCSFDSGDIVLQKKCESWGGEFVDLGADDLIPDRAVLRIVLEVSI